MKFFVHTLGCKANLFDSQQIEADLQAKGWSSQTREGDHPDLCIINTCTVTDEAQKQSERTARTLAKKHPDSMIVVTGCGAEVDPSKFQKVPGVHFIVSNRDKSQLPELIESQKGLKPAPPIPLGSAHGYEELRSRHPLDREWKVDGAQGETRALSESSRSFRTRGFLKIQEGCNSFCTFCIIPYGRGPSRSLKPGPIVQQVQALIQSGMKELVITGTNIGDYGVEWAPKGQALTELLETIFQNTSLERLRVSSLDPTEITEDLIGLMETYPQFCPHFHVSLQSPHSRVLRLMKRRYGYEEVEKCLTRIARVQSAQGSVPFVGMDLITGFPGESDEDFLWGVEALRNLPWSRLHVFPYSERSGTPATKLPGSVPVSVRSARAKQLADLSLERMEAFARDSVQKRSGQFSDVLVESQVQGPDGTSNWILGYSSEYLRILARAPHEELDAKKFDQLWNRTLKVQADSFLRDPARQEVSVLGYFLNQ